MAHQNKLDLEQAGHLRIVEDDDEADEPEPEGEALWGWLVADFW